ncbi:hypothetical protein [Defluviitalea phaphyphila]|uniref:hypothetical protein n=1 Tax=Defluviitalea phaphyphila TaxID=1473580 RepID=UPI0007315374|nr:hypothetical protein [Defluviitalea phaphyphila]
MCKKKILFFIPVIYLFYVLLLALCLTGCGSKKNTDEYTYSSTLNFHKEDYEPEFNQYEKIISVSKETSSKIKVEGAVSEGIILVQLFDPDDTLVKEYSIDDFVQETIETNKKYGDWKVLIKINEDTEGSITISN